MTTPRILATGAALVVAALVIPALLRAWGSQAMAMALDVMAFCF